MKLEIDSGLLSAELQTLAGFSDAPAPAVTRIVFSEQDRRAREYVKGLCLAVDLRVREDAVGNTFARWEGSDPALPAVGTGSHIDAIPHAGRYDGTVGVLGGLEAIRALQRAGVRPRRSIELLIFSAEEPTRFGIGCFSSRMLAGLLDGSGLRDRDGKTLDELRFAAGFHGDLASVPLSPGYYAAFLELHIEQGPLLERSGIPLGVVTAIAAPASFKVIVEGEGGHAGALLMPDRHDALCAAAELVLAVESAARSTGSENTVGTVGVCEVFPGAVNSVPSIVQMEVDVRDTESVRRDGVLTGIQRAAKEISSRRGVAIRIEMVNADRPAVCDPGVVEAVIRAAATHGLPYQKMVSRAYHDSLFMSHIAPVAMLFIPCRDGVSHRPDEYASPKAIAAGTLVLAEALGELAAGAGD
ncbi:MAG TPA: M20 family metallo-hydrolase [Bryobacteraceae bacterium]|nr:M20 family metallo-hydrolase [Bryobacteraceae bacterium]